jgi:hypothetical protein
MVLYFWSDRIICCWFGKSRGGAKLTLLSIQVEVDHIFWYPHMTWCFQLALFDWWIQIFLTGKDEAESANFTIENIEYPRDKGFSIGCNNDYSK